MLSQEDRNKLTESEIAIAQHEANVASRKLAKSLVLGEHNPTPSYREREAPNPAHGVVHIRVIRPRPMWLAVDDEVKRHNSLVANLGVEK